MNDGRYEACARAAHEANRAYCIAIGDLSQLPWETAPEWVRESARAGVVKAIAGATPEELHDAWLNDKVRDGWRYGPTKDEKAKTHPCMVKYSALPEEHRRKDAIYSAVVRAMAVALGIRLPGTTLSVNHAKQPQQSGPMIAIPRTAARLSFLAHAFFCPVCATYTAPFERRTELVLELKHRDWKCEEGIALALAAEKSV